MADQVCCVDQARPGTRTIGGRWFCEEHFARATYRRSGVWRSEFAAVLGLLAFVALVVAVDAWLQPDLTGATLLLVGVVLAGVPAALWLAVFYLQDRLEPEPVGHVVRLFVLGLALAGAIGLPFTEQFFRLSDWLYRDPWTTALGSVLLSGAMEAFLVYAAVRYFIFDSPEFDERTDGVVYGTAAALGYATALNLQFILQSGGAALGSGEVYVAEAALARAAFGGLLGYFLGRAKLEREPVWWLPGGLLLTALLNGLFNLVRLQVEPGEVLVGAGAGLPSFTGLLLAGGLAVLVAAGVYALINRDIARSLRGDSRPAADASRGDRQANLAVLGTFAVLVLAGSLVWNNAVNGVTAFDRSGYRGAYPAYFSDLTAEGEVLRVGDSTGGAEFILRELDLQGETGTAAAETVLSGTRGTDYPVYRVLDRATTRLAGQPAVMQRFVYVDPGGMVSSMPEVTAGIDFILVRSPDRATGGERAVVITLLSPPEQQSQAEPLFARFVNSLTLP